MPLAHTSFLNHSFSLSCRLPHSLSRSANSRLLHGMANRFPGQPTCAVCAVRQNARNAPPDCFLCRAGPIGHGKPAHRPAGRAGVTPLKHSRTNRAASDIA
jgi:hypothetical protein